MPLLRDPRRNALPGLSDPIKLPDGRRVSQEEAVGVMASRPAWYPPLKRDLVQFPDGTVMGRAQAERGGATIAPHGRRGLFSIRNQSTPQNATSDNWRDGGRWTPQIIEERAANAMRMYEIHIERGMTPEHAAGWAANAEAESNGDFRAAQNPGPGRGLFMWGTTDIRGRNFETLYGHPLEQSTEEEQLAFRDWELAHSEAGAEERIARAQTAGDVAAEITHAYERPRREDRNRDAADRANLAEAILRRARSR